MDELLSMLGLGSGTSRSRLDTSLDGLTGFGSTDMNLGSATFGQPSAGSIYGALNSIGSNNGTNNNGTYGSGLGLGLGANIGTAQLALSGLSSLANLWNAFQAQGLANDQFEYTKNVTDTNLNNQIKSYNTALEDRINSRAKAQGMSDEEARQYVEKNRLSRA